jgi:hypothetical protein
MTLNRERERFDNPIVLFNNQSLSMSKNSGNNILYNKSRRRYRANVKLCHAFW